MKKESDKHESGKEHNEFLRDEKKKDKLVKKVKPKEGHRVKRPIIN